MAERRVFELTLTYHTKEESGNANAPTWTFHLSTPGQAGIAGDDYVMPGEMLDELRHELFPVAKALAARARAGGR